MLTNIPETKIFTGYQGQLIPPKVSHSGTSDKIDPSDPSNKESDDTVRISRKAKELEQTYQEKHSSLEDKFEARRQQLEGEYVQQKNELEREYTQKKQALNINLYV